MSDAPNNRAQDLQELQRLQRELAAKGNYSVGPNAAASMPKAIPVVAGSTSLPTLPAIPAASAQPSAAPAIPVMANAGPSVMVPGLPAKPPVQTGTFPPPGGDTRTRFAGNANANSEPTPAFAGPKPDHFLSDLYRKRIEEAEQKKASPWGSENNHPGFLGKAAHLIARAGNIGLDVFAPATSALIPGTQIHGDFAERANERRYEDALTKEAQAGNLASEAASRLNPKPKLISGPEGFRMDAQGNPERAYEMSDGRVEWVSEGQAPSRFIGGSQPQAPGTFNGGGGQSPAPGTFSGSGARQTPGTFNGPVGAPQYTYGTPPQDKTGEEKFVTKYLSDNRLPDTAENRLAAETQYKNGAPIGDGDARQLSTQISNVLKGTGIDPAGYAVSGKSTRGEANEALKAAQVAASEARQEKNAERVANKPSEDQKRKDEHMMGYALDKDGNLAYMSKADADNIHSTFEEQKPGEVNKDRQALRQLNDVQVNTSRYTKAASDYLKVDTATRAKDQVLIHDLLNKAGVSDLKLHGAVEIDLPIISAAAEALSRESKSAAYEGLSKEGKSLMDGYIRTMSAIPAYQKALTGIGRSNKEMLELELNNIANPSMKPEDILRRQQAFQENIDRATEGFPINLPGIKTPKQVRDEAEGKKGGGFKDF